jgi:7-carboxy-7-deazaguanine synthase
MLSSTEKVTITEIYASIQGESCYAGRPCVFVRLTGCPLRCKWCDTVYGFTGGDQITVEEVLEKVKSFGLPLVELTGGEPLAQKTCAPLAKQLIEQDYEVLIETSGSEDISVLDPKVHVIMDLKAPGSGMSDRNLFSNIAHLKSTDEVKIVCANREDYEWAKKIMIEHNLLTRCYVLLSPAFGLLPPKDLAEWIVQDRLLVRLNLQQHKYIWHPRAKGV